MRAIKSSALKEPLVDVVEANAINTTSCQFKTIDILTVRKKDLTFTAPFEITTTRRDYIHAFLVWFDIEFRACHKPITFTTGPRGRYTHWKQTVFYAQEPLVTEVGETITGTISSSPNAGNPRDLDIEISYTHDGAAGTAKDTMMYKMC
ncbi:Nuclear SAM-dependent mono-and asymmetric methyltransferase [Dimargaris xerosporica]|nr:Nuclear SAM-dependent mono-and asymmetric methyltransferase [Dimargaris xerosporica]